MHNANNESKNRVGATLLFRSVVNMFDCWLVVAVVAVVIVAAAVDKSDNSVSLLKFFEGGLEVVFGIDLLSDSD